MPLAFPAQSIVSLDDPRVSGYRSLRERSLRDEGLFVTEGALLAERLLQSRFPIESILVSEGSQARFAGLARERAPLYVAQPSLLRQIVGFDFHRGVLALGRRLPFAGVTSLVEALADSAAESNGPMRLVACPQTETAENLGLIVRSARAFGVHGLLLPQEGADPLSRRCLRQSMGNALFLPTARSARLLDELRELSRSLGLRLVAAVASNTSNRRSAIPLSKFKWPKRSVLAVGHEFSGLDALWLDSCDDWVTIPVAPECDSLNVAVATGVLLHHMSSSSAT